MDSSSQGCSVGEPHVKYKEPPCFQTVPVKSPSFCLGPQASVVLEVAQRVPLSSQWTVLPGREGVVALCVTSSGGTERLEANTSLRELKWSIPRQGTERRATAPAPARTWLTWRTLSPRPTPAEPPYPGVVHALCSLRSFLLVLKYAEIRYC